MPLFLTFGSQNGSQKLHSKAGFALTVAWCAIFVTCIARMLGIVTSIIPTFADCDAGVRWFKNKGRFELSKAYGGTYIPKPTDIVFYGKPSDSTHVGYAVGLIGTMLSVIEGNKSDAVGVRTIDLSDAYIIGYGRVAEYLADTSSTAKAAACCRIQTNKWRNKTCSIFS